jgi:IS5 family transposase
MRQLSFACQPSFEQFARASRREQFVNTMEAVVPWAELEALIEPYYPKAGKGRQPVGLGTMLHVYFQQHWFNLSDPGAEDALYESPVLRGFAGVDLHPAN